MVSTRHVAETAKSNGDDRIVYLVSNLECGIVHSMHNYALHT